MRITWLGQACFLIETKDVSIVNDPYDQKIGIALPKNLKADVVTVSHDHMDHNNISAVAGNPTVVSAIGSSTIKEITFTGIASFHDNEKGQKRGLNTIFKFVVDGVTLAHVGDLGHILNSEQTQQIMDVDILMIPVGGNYTIDATAATKVIAQLKPKIIIPMHYRTKTLGIKLDPVELFTTKINLPVKFLDKLDIDKTSLPQTPEVVVLNIAN